MTADDIIKDITQGKLKPVYLLHGEEPYFIDEITAVLERSILTDSEKGFNQTILYGKDTTLLQCINAAKRYPMMSRYQVVLVKEAQNMKWDTGSSQDADIILGYLNHPLESTILIFAHKHKKLDSRSRIFKQLSKNALVFTSDKVPDYKLAAWVGAYLQKHGHQAEQKAINMIADFLGNNLGKITNEIDKMLLNVAPQAKVTPHEVEAYIGISKEYNVWELQEALAHRNVLKCNAIVNYFAANPKDNPPQRIIPTVAGFFTRLLKFHYAQGSSTVAKDIGVSPYAIKELQAAAANYSLKDVFAVLHLLRRADLQTKGVDSTGHFNDADLLKEMFFYILHANLIPINNETLAG